MGKNNIVISIIIPCLNEELYLENLFSSLRGISTDDEVFEVILVDNGSLDSSVEIARNNGALILDKPDLNISQLRNEGAKIAKGSLYVFIDADCTFPLGWLDKLKKYYSSNEYGIIGATPKCPKNGTWVEKNWQMKNRKGVYYTSFICTANMVVHRSVFWSIDGFNEQLTTGEDYDICQRALIAGYKILNDDSLAVIHWRYPKTLYARFKKEIWYGRNTFDVLKVNPFYRPFWASSIFGLSLILSFLFLFFGKLWLSLTFFSLSFFVVFISTLVKINKSKKYCYFAQLYLLFTIYLAGRFCSTLQVIMRRFVKV